VLVATSEARIGNSAVRSSLLFERQVRGTVIHRQLLSFDTRFAAAASGKPEPVGHLFMMLAGRFVSDRGEVMHGPVAFMLSDEEWERRGKTTRTFRTDGTQVEVVQLRIASEHIRVPIGLTAGAISLAPPTWNAVAALLAREPDAPALAHLLDALTGDRIIVETPVVTEEPERFRRLWAAMAPLFQQHGATTSLKQLAGSLDMSMRQVGRDAKELSAAFGIAGGYRDALLVLRMRLAVLLLSAPGASVADVAKLVGYGSPIAMARAFRDAKLPPPSSVQEAMSAE
jgi:AraC-like DNA-binding protein